MSIIGLRTELNTVLNSPAPFDIEQSRYELSNQFLDRLFDTYVAENGVVGTGNMPEKSISKKIINQCCDDVNNTTDNPIILSALTQALSEILSQSSNE